MRSHGDNLGDPKMSKKKGTSLRLILDFNESPPDKNSFRSMKEGHIYTLSQIFLIFTPGLSGDLSKFSHNFTPFFDFEITKKSEATFCSASLVMNKCAKLHGDIPSGYKL